MRRLNHAPPRRSAAATRLRRRIRWVALSAVLAAGVWGLVLSGLVPPVQQVSGLAKAWLLERTAALGLRVEDIQVEGGTTTDRAAILSALRAGPGTPILAIDPARAEQRLVALPWVSSAVIERRLPNTVYVRLVERRPLALWQRDGKMQLIDDTGTVIPVARLDRFARLPLVVGPDAAKDAASLIAMLATQPDLDRHVTAAVRVGGRRWNVRIDGRIVVLLPEDDPASAWAALAHLERSSAILDREVEAIDMRLPDRLVVRLVPQPPKEASPEPGKRHPSAKNT
jgi:cell division protein FtsQ